MRRRAKPCPPCATVQLCPWQGGSTFAYGDGVGNTLTISGTPNSTTGSLVHIFAGAFLEDSAVGDDLFSLQSVVDSDGNALKIYTSTGAVCGAGGVEWGALPHYNRLLYGPTAISYYDPGELHTGMTFTLTWDCTNPAALSTSAMAFALCGAGTTVVPRARDYEGICFTDYGEGDVYPDLDADPTSFNWKRDLGFLMYPCDLAYAVGYVATVPGTGSFLPAAGEVIGFRDLGNWSHSAILYGIMQEGQTLEPGGQFGSPVTAAVSKMQYGHIGF